MRWVWASVAFLLTAFLAPAEATGTTTSLYAVFDTHATPPQLQAVEPSNDTAALGECRDDGTGTTATSEPIWVLPFRAGPVEFGFLENGTPRVHPEKGLGMDLHLTAATLHWFLDIPPMHDGMPIRLRAEVREGSEGDTADLEAGNLVARGETSDLLLPSGVQEVVLPLEMHGESKVAKREGFTLFVTVHDGLDCVAPLRTKATSQDGHRSRLQLTTKEGVTIEFLHSEVAAGIVLMQAAVQSPFGSGDIDVDNMTLQVTGPTPPVSLQQVVAQHVHVHNLHDEPVEVTWMWRYRDDKAQDGTYRLDLVAWNVGHTSTANATQTFLIQGVGHDRPAGMQEPKPASALPLVPPILAIAALLARRR